MKKFSIILVLFTFLISCKKEVVEPVEVPPTTIVAENFDHIIVRSEQGDVGVVDSVVYLNHNTGVTQTWVGNSSVIETCSGTDYEVRNFSLSQNYVSDDDCDITIYFNGGGYKIFLVLLLKPSETSCDISGQGTVHYTTLSSYTVTRTL